MLNAFRSGSGNHESLYKLVQTYMYSPNNYINAQEIVSENNVELFVNYFC